MRGAEPLQHALHVAERPVGLGADALGRRLGRIVETAKPNWPVRKTKPSTSVAWLLGETDFRGPVEDMKFWSRSWALKSHRDPYPVAPKTRHFRPFAD